MLKHFYMEHLFEKLKDAYIWKIICDTIARFTSWAKSPFGTLFLIVRLWTLQN